MLVKDPAKRYTIDECLSHPWTTAENPGVNDSTLGLVDAVAGLDVNRRGVARERTLLSALNDVQVTGRVHMGADKPDLKIYSKNPKIAKNKVAAVASKVTPKEMRPDDARSPHEFVTQGGKGDQVLFRDDTGSVYEKADIAAVSSGDTPEKSKTGKGKGKGKAGKLNGR